jgi:1-deoxy-D-xylulose 5-phosphate reductoisomerase
VALVGKRGCFVVERRVYERKKAVCLAGVSKKRVVVVVGGRAAAGLSSQAETGLEVQAVLLAGARSLFGAGEVIMDNIRLSGVAVGCAEPVCQGTSSPASTLQD